MKVSSAGAHSASDGVTSCVYAFWVVSAIVSYLLVQDFDHEMSIEPSVLTQSLIDAVGRIGASDDAVGSIALKRTHGFVGVGIDGDVADAVMVESETEEGSAACGCHFGLDAVAFEFDRVVGRSRYLVLVREF